MENRWLVKAKDQAGKVHDLHMTGPATEADVRNVHAIRNWEILKIEPTTREPLRKGVLNPSAYEAGVKKELDKSRRR
jgi:hypothetical protein